MSTDFFLDKFSEEADQISNSSPATLFFLDANGCKSDLFTVGLLAG